MDPREPPLTEVDEFDFCPACRGGNFVLDRVSHERICTDCGVVGLYEWGEVPPLYDRPKSYVKCAYFTRTTLASALLQGATLDGFDITVIQKHYNACVASFNRTRVRHGRKNFLHNGFILSKIGDHMGLDFRPHLKLPITPATTKKLEDDWEIICPWNQ